MNGLSNRVCAPRCPRCGGRLFLDREFWGRRLVYFWECSLGCGQQFDARVGKPSSSLVKHLAKQIPVPVGV